MRLPDMFRRAPGIHHGGVYDMARVRLGQRCPAPGKGANVRCDGILVRRYGQYGQFIGCSRFGHARLNCEAAWTAEGHEIHRGRLAVQDEYYIKRRLAPLRRRLP